MTSAHYCTMTLLRFQHYHPEARLAWLACFARDRLISFYAAHKAPRELSSREWRNGVVSGYQKKTQCLISPRGENGTDRNFRGNYYCQQRWRLVPCKLSSGHLIFISSNYYLAIKFYSSLCMHAPGVRLA